MDPEKPISLSSGTLLTDVAGVKCHVLDVIQDFLREDLEFIGSHPMAGKEVYGVRNSDESIFKIANFIVTRPKRTRRRQSTRQDSWAICSIFTRSSSSTPQPTTR